MVSLSISWLGLRNYDFHEFFNVFCESDEKPSQYKSKQRKPIKALRVQINE